MNSRINDNNECLKILANAPLSFASMSSGSMIIEAQTNTA